MPTISPVNKIRVKGVYYDLVRFVKDTDSSAISSMTDDSSLMKVYVDANDDNVYVASHSDIIKMADEDKTLTQMAGDVKEDIEEINSILNKEDNISFLTRADVYTTKNYYIDNTGAYHTATSQGIGLFFKVNKHDRITITPNSNYNAQYALVKTLPPTAVIYASGESGRHVITAGSDAESFIVPESCYLYLMGTDVVGSISADHFPSSVEVKESVYHIPSTTIDSATFNFSTSEQSISYSNFSSIQNDNKIDISAGELDLSETSTGSYYIILNGSSLTISTSILNGVVLGTFELAQRGSVKNIESVSMNYGIECTVQESLYSQNPELNRLYIKGGIALKNVSRSEKDAIFYERTDAYGNISDSGTRIKVIFPVLKDEYVRMVFGSDNQFYYTTQISSQFKSPSIVAPNTTEIFPYYSADTFIANNGTENSFSLTMPSDGYFQITIKKGSAGTDAFSDEDVAYIEDTLKVFIGNQNDFLKENGWKQFYIGDTFLQRGIDSTGIATSSNSQRVSMGYVFMVPFENSSFMIMMPREYRGLIRFGKFDENSPFNSYMSNVRNGHLIEVPDGYQFMIICFYKPNASSYYDVTPEEIQTLVRNGDIAVYCKGKDCWNDIAESNVDSENYVLASLAPFETNALNNNPDRLTTFLHISDLHGDAYRYERSLQYAQRIGIDYILVTGDMCMWKGEQGCQYVYDLAKKYNQKVFTCVGNHDSWGAYHSMSVMSQNVIMPCIDEEDCVYDSQTTYPTYYYKDLTNDMIRLISLNQYDTYGRNNASGTYYTQRQIDWFMEVLLSTPSNYGIVIIEHTPDVSIRKDSSHSEFYQDNLASDATYPEGLANTTNVLTQIIDAFISGGTINTSITQQKWSGSTSTNETLILNKDFSTKNGGVEFLFFANGHAHIDRIGYASTATNDVLIMNVCIGNAQKKSTGRYVIAAYSDLPRRLYGVSQDAFNIYSVDRTNHNIRVARVGSNITQDLKERKYMIIPYKQ